MLKNLADYLTQYDSAFHAFHYITLRAILSVITALFISFIFGSQIIRLLEKLRARQSIRSEGPQSHYSKAGTPTMGGVLIVISVIITTILWGDLNNRYLLIALVTIVAFATIGGADDMLKLKRQSSRGLSIQQKYFFQSLAGFLIAWVLYAGAQLPVETQLIVPFFKEVMIDLGPWFILLAYLTIVGSSNAVNLTDGLDGLAVMPAVLIAGALSVFAYASSHAGFAGYLAIPHIPMTGELVIFSASLVGAGLGFLWFNTYPAQVFMGDVGALALGSAIGLIAVLVRQEIVLLVMGGLFVVETISVIIQIISYRTTGQRVFRMAPLHHHFELHGWPEPRIIVRFWIITLMLVLAGLATLKIR